jgi:hypothetical protein
MVAMMVVNAWEAWPEMAIAGAWVRLSHKIPTRTRLHASEPLRAMEATWPLVKSGPMMKR